MYESCSRRTFLKATGLSATAACLNNAGHTAAHQRPNIILCMADDLGWGDTGYNGHPKIKTPNLDDMAQSGLRFDRFYAGAPVCSPTRGSAITGRHPYRYGIWYANTGHMREEEVTLAEVLKEQGYTTGHFGKWHLGTLTTEMKDSNRGKPGNIRDYQPPQVNGFDVCFSTEAKVPTWDPMKDPKTGEPYGTRYWNKKGQEVTENLAGDDSRVIMDRAVPFIKQAAKDKRPFFAVVWFHTPHKPCVAGPQYRAMYKDEPEPAQHYYGCITALDDQMGRLRKTLREAGVADNTMLWFCSDNGPEDPKYDGMNGSAGPFRGRKRSLYEGGIRVASMLEWPAQVEGGRNTSVPCVTSDYFPTVLEAVGIKAPPPVRPIDGINLIPLIAGKMKQRPTPIGFQSKDQSALSDNRYKLYRPKPEADYELYDLIEDPGERNNIAPENNRRVKKMVRLLERWQGSCKDSYRGQDY